MYEVGKHPILLQVIIVFVFLSRWDCDEITESIDWKRSRHEINNLENAKKKETKLREYAKRERFKLTKEKSGKSLHISVHALAFLGKEFSFKEFLLERIQEKIFKFNSLAPRTIPCYCTCLSADAMLRRHVLLQVLSCRRLCIYHTSEKVRKFGEKFEKCEEDMYFIQSFKIGKYRLTI